MRFGTRVIKDSLLLSPHASGRYLVNANGTPKMLHAEAAWSGIVQLDQTDAGTYLDSCQSLGINAINLMLIAKNQGTNAPSNIFNDAPFSGTAFQSTPNEDYFDHALWFVRAAAARGLVCAMVPAYLGNPVTDGWDTELENATNSQVQTYGEYAGDKFKDEDNIAWVLYGDRDPPDHARTNALQAGIASTDSRHVLFSSHYNSENSSYQNPESWFTFLNVYNRDDVGDGVHSDTIASWQASPTRPVFFWEGRYRHFPTSGTETNVRREQWATLLSGSLAGALIGNERLWPFNFGWQYESGPWEDQLNEASRIQRFTHCRGFFDAIPWWLLVPDISSTLFTGSRGSGSDYVTASLASDASLAAAHFPDGAGAQTVDTTQLAGTTYNANWFDPRNGGYTLIGNGISQATDDSFTKPDSNDWVLKLEAA